MGFLNIINYPYPLRISTRQYLRQKEAFAYKAMLFGLINDLSKFQRLMNHILTDFLRKFLEVYVDDLCVHSWQRMDHLSQLRSIFKKCQLYQLSLNPKKCVFMMRQGKILGHIVSKNGICTDEEKIKVIVNMPKPMLETYKPSWGIVATIGDLFFNMPP